MDAAGAIAIALESIHFQPPARRREWSYQGERRIPRDSDIHRARIIETDP
jgi:hypothetical protein